MALLKVLLLLLLGVSVNSGVSLQKRIIGGENCDNTERLYHVRLESTNGTHMIRCGGSLIRPRWILTAAHCWKSEPGWTLAAMLKIHPRTVIRYRQVIQQAPAIYRRFGEQHDIMLLKLPTAVTDFPLAELPDCRYRLRVGFNVHLAGEGGTTIGTNNERIPSIPPVPANLQCVDMQIVRTSFIVPNRGFIFSVAAPNTDICYGDIGGAATYSGKIYGVISIGAENSCQSPVAILDVCEYKDWIRTRIRHK